MKILFIINPVSGGNDKSALTDDITAYFRNMENEPIFVFLDGKQDGRIVRNAISEHQPDRVVAVGGDGTVKIVAEHLMGTAIPLGILPAGSANGLARELALPATTPELLDIFANGTAQPLDAISVNDDICLHLSDIGLNAQLVKYYAENNWRGKMGYLRGVVRTLYRKRLLDIEIHSKKESFACQAFMVVLANARMYGTGAIINPEGELSDGAFEVIILRDLSFWEFLKMFWRYKPFDPNKIHIFPATSITIRTRRKAYFQVDGEYKGKIKEVKARIRSGELTVLMPPQAGEPT
ncbi:diacylglycerol kinase [Arsenicibacter rosenii]|uniref:Diacylglycerol kinase n=1 Tax=Arsenicibacter rosenii TaxID=1750698 RepID=A0A1S2VGU4_9BACT|nr:diacylglycerol kinase [Arsenicibacter rosenii]